MYIQKFGFFLPMLNADKGADAGVGDEKAADKKEDAKTVKKIELTEAELEQRIADARKDEKDAIAQDQRKAKEKTDREDAEKKGEHEKIAQQERVAREQAEKDRDDAKLQLRAKDVEIQIREALTKEGHAAGNSKYIAPLVTFDLTTKDETIATRVKGVVADYVKDNPVTKGNGAPPALRGRGVNGSQETNKQPAGFSTEARIGF